MLAFQALVAAFALVMLWRHGPRALAFAAPSLGRLRAGPPAPARSAAEQRAREALAELGFRDAATLEEAGPLGALRVRWAVLAGGDTYADVDARGAIRFVSPCAGGPALVTATWRRPPISGRGGRVAGLPGATPQGALAAHRAGLAAFAAENGAPSAPPDPASRLEAARRWARTLGRRERRLATALNFVNALIALALLASAVKALLPALRFS